MEKIVKTVQEDKAQWSLSKDVGYSQFALSKIRHNYKINGGWWLKKVSMLLYHNQIYGYVKRI